MELPTAVLSVDDNKRAHVCAWCKGKEEAENWCRARNLTVTHGMCPQCKAGFMLSQDPTEI